MRSLVPWFLPGLTAQHLLFTAFAALAPHAAAPASRLRERAAEAYAAGRHDRAIDLLGAELRRSPGDPALHVELAYAYQAAGDLERSAAAAEEASRLEEDPFAAWGARVLSALEAGRLGEAQVGTQALQRLRPGDCAPLRLGARVAQRRGDLAGAEADLRRAALACPSDASAVADWGSALLALGCVSEATTVLERAERMPGTAPALAAALGRVRAEVSRRYRGVDAELALLETDALRALEGDAAARDAASPRFHALYRALQRDGGGEGDDPERELRLAELFRLGEGIGIDQAAERARMHVQRALEMRPEWPRALVLLGVLELSLEKPQPRAAERAFLAALATSGADVLPSAWSGLSFAYLAEGRIEDALLAADRYLGFAPEDQAVAELRQRLLAVAQR